MDIELFHAIGDAGSAAARRFVVEHALEDKVRFRNLHYPEVEEDYRARAGTQLPALWDGAHLIQGEAAVMEALAHLARP